MQIEFSDVSVGYGGGADVLSDVSVLFSAGWTGVVGANGAGKSTLVAALLRSLGGAPAPESGPEPRVLRGGRITPTPAPLSVISLAQRCGTFDAVGEARSDGGGEALLGEPVQAFAWRFDREALRWRSRLALSDAGPEGWATLSPGERRRWQVAAALCERPHVLVLDEPLNHLDTYAREIVVDALRGFEGIGLLVSHDRALLDALTTSTVRVHQGSAVQYVGGYSEASAQWRAGELRLSQEAERKQQAARRERRAAQARVEVAARAELQRSRTARMKNAGDVEQRSAPQQHRADHGAAVAARAAGKARARATAAVEAAAAAGVRSSRAPGLAFAYAADRRDTLLPAEALWDGAATWSVGLSGASRWWVWGQNGAGKSRWLRAQVAALARRGVATSWVSQLLEPGEARAALQAMDSVSRGHVLRSAGALGVDVPALLRSERWSPGEERKVSLALAAHRPSACLVLDEPTNHLDLPAREALAHALAAYGGALLLATHDSALAMDVVSHSVEMQEGVAGRPRACTSGELEA